MNTFTTKINRFTSGLVNETNELTFEAIEEELIQEEEDHFLIDEEYHPILKQLIAT